MERITIPNAAELIISRLEEHGFEAYVVGGCVRDSIMGITPHDWDICTSALPEQIIEVFSDLKLIDQNGIDWDFDSITDLVSKYEDVKEKYGWFISIYGHPNFISKIGNESVIDRLRRRGNYFKTEKEAEEVAEKVRALLLKEKERRSASKK